MSPASAIRSLAARRAEFFMRRELAALGDTPFSIIANDCWGGEVYRLAARPFSTPFIGLFVVGPCYMRILEDLDAALGSELVPIEHSRYAQYDPPAYPLGLLRAVDAEVHFLHYGSFADASAKWHRRAARVDREALFIKSVVFGYGEVDRFRELSYARKIISAPAPVPGVDTALGRGLPDAVLDFRSAAVRFSAADWLSGGSGQISNERLPGRWLRYAGWC